MYNFNLGQQVLLKALTTSAVVTAYMTRLGNLPQYEVTYWYEGSRKSEWVYEVELQAISSKPCVVPQPA